MKSTRLQFGFLCICVMHQLQHFLVYAQQNCNNPNGNSGSCISIYDCSSLLQVVEQSSVSNEERNFLRESQCSNGIGRLPYVCCGSDKNYVRNVPTTTTLRPTATSFNTMSGDSSLPSPPKCGPDSFSDKIYNGNNTALDEFTWMVLLEYVDRRGNRQSNCGGSLINNRYVLTAAHCVKGAIETQVGRLTRVRVGEYDTSTDVDCVRGVCNPAAFWVDVEEAIPYPEFDDKSKDRHHDIALIRLSQPVELNEYIQPVCLPLASTRRPITTGDPLVVSGWGRTLMARNSAVKQRLTLPITDHQTCANKFASRKVNLIESQICAGGEFLYDSCDGDSGGPLMRQAYEKAWYQEGVVSFGNRCGLEGWPGVYTRVADYIDWIENTIRP